MALVFGIVATVFWAATYTAWVTFLSAQLLVVEALCRFVGAVKSIPEPDIVRSNLGPDLYDQAVTRLNEYRGAQRQPLPVPDEAKTPWHCSEPGGTSAPAQCRTAAWHG